MTKSIEPGKRIRNSLFWQLIVAFVIIICLAGGGVLAVWRIAWSEERPDNDYLHRMDRCARRLTEHYDRERIWDGVDTRHTYQGRRSARWPLAQVLV
jgi:hypothetical protein